MDSTIVVYRPAAAAAHSRETGFVNSLSDLQSSRLAELKSLLLALPEGLKVELEKARRNENDGLFLTRWLRAREFKVKGKTNCGA